jgi:hypothetical protein
MAWAYIKDGMVVDFVRVEPNKVFLSEYAAKFIEAPDDVDNGWTYDGTTFKAPSQPSADELVIKASAAARALRNQLLAETDWTQVADVPQTTKDKWSAYRQALRDVPQQTGFPNNIQWPSKPE